MYNLYVKDFYLVRKRLWVAMFYSFMLLILFSSQGSQGIIYSVGTVMIGYTMIMYITAYDDKNNSEVLLNSLPVSRGTIVLARYLSVFAFAIIGVFSMALAGFLLKSFGVLNISRILRLEDFIGAVAGLSIIAFLYLPAYFKYGYIKAKMFNLIFFIIGFGGPMLSRRLLKGPEKPMWIDKLIDYLTSQSEFVVGLLIIAIIIIFGLASLGLSMAAYRKREF